MMVRRAFVAALAAWVAVVLVGASTVWAVISRAGEDLVSTQTLPTTGDSRATTLNKTIKVTRPSGPLPHKPRRTAGPGGSGPSAGSSGQPDESTPGDPSTEPARPGTSSPGTDSSPPPPPPAPTVKTDTWQGPPGSVTVSCKGATIQPNYVVSPAGGWRPEGPDYSPSRLEVHFERTNGDGEYEITARCEGGSPVFSSHGGEHGD
jgi:hypothetical protein